MSHLRPVAASALLAACLFWVAPAAAQEAEPRPGARPGGRAYLIEVEREGECSFAPVRGTSGRGSLLFTVPRPNAPDAPGRPSASAVTTTAERDGEAWRVSVVVNLGEFYDAGARLAESVKVRAGESHAARAVERFGVRPFRVRVVEGFGEEAQAPRVLNRTVSVAAERVEWGALPEPYRFAFRNNSGKELLAVQLIGYAGGRHQFLKWRDGGARLRPLTGPGALYEMEVQSMDRACAGPDGRVTGQSDTVEIASAVFADGSYEGSAGLAALIRGRALGNLKNLARALEALEALGRRADPSADEAASHLEGEAAAMDETADEPALARLRDTFPAPDAPPAPALNDFVRHGMHEVKASLARDARKWAAARGGKPAGGEEVRAWLARTRRSYERWRAAAAAVAGHH